MKLTLSWHNPGHVLLNAPLMLVTSAGTPVAPAMAVGQARVTITPGPGQPVRVQANFKTTLGTGPLVLAIDQDFTLDASGVPVASAFRIPNVGGAGFVRVPGRHPLLSDRFSAGSWQIVIDTRLVDATDVSGSLFFLLAPMINPSNDSRVRLLARTDGALPAFWLAVVPRACRGAAASDILCFFAPPQGSPAADVPAQLTTRSGELTARLGVFAGQGLHTLPGSFSGVALNHRLLDHFTPGSGEFVLAHGWEQAVADTPKRCALVLPVPASGGYGDAAGAKLPGLLKNVHALLHAHGSIAPPADTALGAPQLALGAHSFGAVSLFAALRADIARIAIGRPAAFTDVLLFEPMAIQQNIDLLISTPARIGLVGFDVGSAVGPFHTLKGNPAVAPRVRLLPMGYPGDRPDKATFAQIVAHSPDPAPSLNPPSLGHAISTISSAAIARFNLLHQYVVWGGDDMGGVGVESHFLSQALNGSSLR